MRVSCLFLSPHFASLERPCDLPVSYTAWNLPEARNYICLPLHYQHLGDRERNNWVDGFIMASLLEGRWYFYFNEIVSEQLPCVKAYPEHDRRAGVVEDMVSTLRKTEPAQGS